MNEPKPNRHPAIKPLGLLFVMLLSAITSIAQTRTVRGTVKDDTGAPLIGASVVVAGKQTGTTTNVDGKFSLPVAPGAILEVSYIGYLTQRVEASRNGDMEIVLKSDQMDIEGVTVIGYGSVNHPVDRDPVCGFSGIIGDQCPGCGRTEADGVPFERIRRITGYLVGTLDRFNNGKRAEERDRVKHSV